MGINQFVYRVSITETQKRSHQRKKLNKKKA